MPHPSTRRPRGLLHHPHQDRAPFFSSAAAGRRGSEPGTLPYLICKPATMARLSVRRRQESCVRRCFQGRGFTGLSIPSSCASPAVACNGSSGQSGDDTYSKLTQLPSLLLQGLLSHSEHLHLATGHRKR